VSFKVTLAGILSTLHIMLLLVTYVDHFWYFTMSEVVQLFREKLHQCNKSFPIIGQTRTKCWINDGELLNREKSLSVTSNRAFLCLHEFWYRDIWTNFTYIKCWVHQRNGV
jgi:hypothetical protein